MNISTIAKPVNTVIKAAACNQRVRNLTAQMAKSENLYSNIALTTILAKILNGRLFSSFAYIRNKEIPEEQRRFLAFQELAIGGMAATTTLTMNLFLKKTIREFMTNKFKPVANWLKKLPPELALESKKGIGIASTLGAIIIANRIIIPYLSMPITKYLKEHFAPKTRQQNDFLQSINDWHKDINKKEFIG